MELRHLRYFVAVAEELSFRRAARRLNISQPPLSLQIRQLEEEVGGRLFDRSQQRVALTTTGRLFLGHARLILGEVTAAKFAVSLAETGEGGELRIGFTGSAEFQPFMSRTIRALRELYPSIELTLCEMSSTHQLEALERRDLDLGFCRAFIANAGRIEILKTFRDNLVAVVPDRSPLTQRAGVSILDLRDEAFVALSQASGAGLRNYFLDLCMAKGFTPRITQEARELTTLIALAAAGLGVAIVPSAMRCVAMPGAHFVSITDKDAQPPLHLVHNKDDGSKVKQRFVDALNVSG